MDHVRHMFEHDLFAKHAGIELISVSPGQATAKMSLQPWHLNGVNTVQGGAIFTLADFAFAAAANSRDKVAVAVNVSITFMKAATTGTLTAEAREVALNPKLGTYTVNVTDEQGSLIAIFQGLAYRKS
ncbi:MAG: hotdog fold thioesterase [Verrucomicrobia bacterium]|nr:hotdog fold thioesterase [Verrucomicrobiota bacterium]